MQTTIHRYRLQNAIAMLILFPATCFIAANLLNEVGMPALYQSIDQWVPQKFGFNLNLLILLGPAVALCIASFQVLRIRWQFSKEHAKFGVIIKRKWVPIAIGLLSGLVMGTLFTYLVLENVNH